mmetsp:Transcript_37585/g.57579  ORF Transcript_37585/g.57579 Transcript_37585/m.57579 type:complete len:195 (+) Transcript_37585:1530-2114(+)
MFKKSLAFLGKDYVAAKLKENKVRLSELNKIVEQLQIPESYPNRGYTQKYYDRIHNTLEKKTEKYLKYVENTLKQAHVLSGQIEPLGLAKLKKNMALGKPRSKSKTKTKKEGAESKLEIKPETTEEAKEEAKDDALDASIGIKVEDAEDNNLSLAEDPLGNSALLSSKKDSVSNKETFLIKIEKLDKLDLEPKD